MEHSNAVGDLLRQVRVKSQLTQRDLARVASTAQSVVARIELGVASPTVSTLKKLLNAAGFEIEVRAQPVAVLDPQILDDVPRILRLSPEQRLKEVANINKLFARARRVS